MKKAVLLVVSLVCAFALVACTNPITSMGEAVGEAIGDAMGGASSASSSSRSRSSRSRDRDADSDTDSGTDSESEVSSKEIEGFDDAISKTEGDIRGEVGIAYHTQWFAFRVESIDRVSVYAGYRASSGYELIDVVVTELNTYGQSITMGTFDFYLDSDTFLDYAWPLDPRDDTMMPENFDLPKGEEVTYHMVYEVPVGLTDLVVCYTEINDEGDYGDTFTIPVPN